MFRTPMLPFRVFAEWAKGIEIPDIDADEQTWADAVDTGCKQARARLRELLAQAHIRDALFVASPGLETEVQVWMERPNTDRGRRIEWALTRYLARMAGRATPFGLFSGISVGTLDRRTRLETAPRTQYERHTRLDNDYLFALSEHLTQQPDIRDQLVFWPNDSLFESGDRLRYVEARLQDKRRSHQLVTVEYSEYVAASLKRAQAGATPRALALALVHDDPEIELDEARAFIDELIDSQLLVSRLTPAVTGAEPIHGIIGELRDCADKGVASARTAADCLASVTRELDALDRDGLGASPVRYRALAAQLESLSVPVDLARLFQVDMVKPAPEAVLSARDVRDITRGVDALHRLGLAAAKDTMRSFREAFRQRYEGREVPLLEALDEDSGVGFMPVDPIVAEPSPLLQGLVFPPQPPADESKWLPAHSMLARKLQKCHTPADGALEITTTDLDALPSPASTSASRAESKQLSLPDAFAVMAVLAQEAGERTDERAHPIHIMFASGPSGARLAGRFCHASPDVEQAVRDHLRAEEALRPDAVFAEIVHLPEGRVGNIMCRPVLRAYEIPYLGVSGASVDKRIPLDDLMISVTQERVVLRSRRLGREVIPRLSTAHNIALGTSIYRFLGYVQNDNITPARWSWGPFGHLPYLPRVTHGRLVFARAQWRLDKSELGTLAKAAKVAKGQGALARTRVFRQLQRLRRERQLPRLVVLIDGDNELPVDLDNPLSCDSFAQMVKGRSHAMVCEQFPDTSALSTHGPEGKFVSQIVLSFVRDQKPRSIPQRRRPDGIQRTFMPGSEWLYAKLYTGVGHSDRILTDTVAPLVGQLGQQGAYDGWFFIRYSDPEPHIRLRFRGERQRLAAEVLPALERATAELVDQGAIWRMQLDTYHRELERYGGAAGMALSEQLFAIDSDAVLAMMPYISGDDGADLRWQMAVYGVDRLLDDFGLDMPARFALMRQLRDGFGAEFRADASFYKQIGVPFRERRRALIALMTRDFEDALAEEVIELDDDEEWEDPSEQHLLACVRALRARSQRIRPLAAQLRERVDERVQPHSGLIASYIHMYLNRLFRWAHRAQELVTYDYLRRVYASLRASRKSSEKTPG